MVGRHKREEKLSLASEQGGAFPCTTPIPQRPHAAGACTASTTHAQPNSPAAEKEARQGREALVERREREEKESLGNEQGGGIPMHLQTQNVLMRPVHAQPAQPLPNRTHKLQRRKYDKGGKRMVGRHKREQK